MPHKNLEKFKVHRELIALLEILVDLIITLDCVKIGMIPGIVLLVIVAYIYTTDRIIKQVGNNKEIFKEQKNKDGEE